MAVAAEARPYAPYALPSTLVWSDEFEGPNGSPPNPANWLIEEGFGIGGSAEEEQVYTGRASNVALDGASHLQLTARRESYEGHEYTSGRIGSKRNGVAEEAKISAQYGRIEARINAPAGKGFWPAFWMQGINNGAVKWPLCGEIDIMEQFGDGTRTTSSLHGGNPHWSILGELKGSLTGAFHNYGLLWWSDRLEFTVDGIVFARRNRSVMPMERTWPFEQPFFFTLDLAVGGPTTGKPTEATPFPSSMLVDWVRVYQ